MKLRIILLIAVAILISSIHVFGQEKETPKQKEIAAQFQKESKQLQDETEKLILPLEGQKFRIDEQIKDIQKDLMKKLNELQNKYAKLYKDAEVKEEKK